MANDSEDRVREATERVIELEAELEAAGHATVDDSALDFAREALHQWVDSAIQVVATPGLGRVTLIHADGRRSSISSADLPFLVAKPVGWDGAR
jgi:hypothetical protein